MIIYILKMGNLYSYQENLEADPKSKRGKHLVCEQIKMSKIKLKPVIPVTNNYKKKKRNNIVRL